MLGKKYFARLLRKRLLALKPGSPGCQSWKLFASSNLYAGVEPLLVLSQLTNFAASNQLKLVAGLFGPRESSVIPSGFPSSTLSALAFRTASSGISYLPIR